MLTAYTRLFRSEQGQQLRPSAYPPPHTPSRSTAVTGTQDCNVPKSEEGAESSDIISEHNDKLNDPLAGGPEQQRNSPHKNADKQEGGLPLDPRSDAKTAGSYSSYAQGSVGRRSSSPDRL